MPYFHFLNYELPTRLCLRTALEAAGWQRALYAKQATIHEAHLSFDNACLETLEHKDKLAELLSDESIMPPTIVLSHTHWREQLERCTFPGPWFLKPAWLNNGVGIQVCDTKAAVQDYYQSPGRFDGPHVLQQAVRPHLYQGHKWSIRRLAVLTHTGNVIIYPEGYANIAAQPHNVLDAKKAQVTNLILDNQYAGITQRLCHQMPLTQTQWAMMDNIMMDVIQRFVATLPKPLSTTSSMVPLGFDFIVSHIGEIKLLEVNEGMDCPRPTDNNPLFETLWTPFWQFFLSSLRKHLNLKADLLA